MNLKMCSFKYPETDNYVLKNINFKIINGSSLGIIGHTGCGKTTLINLIPRIYDTTEGKILIDGIDIKEIPLGYFKKLLLELFRRNHFYFQTQLKTI